MNLSIDKIISEYGDSILKICIGYSKSQEDSKDLYQDVLLNIWKGLESFKGNSEVKTWVYRIAINTCLLNKRKIRVKTVEFDPVKHVLSDTLFNINNKNSQLDKLLELIHKMPKKDRSILLLYLEGFSYKEISEVIGITVSNVGVKINRAKNFLSININKYG